MSVTVEELIKNTNRKELKLVAGDSGLKRVVRWVHMVENVEISSFLEGQEIAFTTGVGLESEEDLFELVKYNYNQNASAMVINIGPFIERISESILSYCKEHDFPLFEVPWNVHMANIMRNFSMEILESEKEQMMLASAVKNAMFFPGQEDTYIPTLESYHFLGDWSYCVALVEITDKLGEYVHKNIQERIGKIIDSAVVHGYENTAVFIMEQQIVLFFANYNDEEVKKILTTVFKEVMVKFPENCNSYWGVGECTKNIKCISKSYKKARNAMMLQRKTEQSNKIRFYSDLGLYKILLSVDSDNALKDYYNQILYPLEEYDAINGTDFLEVLKVYFQCECSVQETAEELFMHRNSIRYKINKIQELTGMNLSVQMDKTRVQIAFMVRELLH